MYGSSHRFDATPHIALPSKAKNLIREEVRAHSEFVIAALLVKTNIGSEEGDI
jgi:hypothetical protein